jgi:DNA-binding Lrp family transcriptional regulator
MRDLDETDRRILRLLLADSRRPYSDIADHVDLSPPAVSDRIDRLREVGIIERFTVDIDRSRLRNGTPVLVHLSMPPTAAPDAADALVDRDAVEHVFRTVDGTVTFQANAESREVTGFLDGVVDMDVVRDIDVELLAESTWSPDLGNATLALSCSECGNVVTDEGTTARLGGDLYQFCCPSCESVFRERFEDFEEAA